MRLNTSKYVLLFVLLFLNSCVVEHNISYDQPEINILLPVTGSIIGDTVMIDVAASDDSKIERVEFYIDNVLDTTQILYSEPFQYTIQLNNDSSYIMKTLGKEKFDIGSQHKIFAKVIDDTDLEMISNMIVVDYKYRSLIVDDNDFFSVDIKSLMVRSTDERIDFRFSSYGTWRRITDSTGINLGIFLDTDQDSTTGFSSDSEVMTYTRRLFNADSIYYPINNIGADYALFSSFEGDRGIYKWDSNSEQWNFVDSFHMSNLKKDTTVAEFSIKRSSINNPSEINVVVGNMYYLNNSSDYYWDIAPNNGHANYIVEDNYLGNETF